MRLGRCGCGVKRAVGTGRIAVEGQAVGASASWKVSGHACPRASVRRFQQRFQVVQVHWLDEMALESGPTNPQPKGEYHDLRSEP
jgi:hypothetical protein